MDHEYVLFHIELLMGLARTPIATGGFLILKIPAGKSPCFTQLRLTRLDWRTCEVQRVRHHG